VDSRACHECTFEIDKFLERKYRDPSNATQFSQSKLDIDFLQINFLLLISSIGDPHRRLKIIENDGDYFID